MSEMAGEWECVIAPGEGPGGVKLVAPDGEVWWVIGNVSGSLVPRLLSLEKRAALADRLAEDLEQIGCWTRSEYDSDGSPQREAYCKAWDEAAQFAERDDGPLSDYRALQTSGTEEEET